MPLLASIGSVLPPVKSLADCADFSLTVKPYLLQLKTFPQDVVAHITSPSDLKHVYLNTNPLIVALAFSLFVSTACLVVSEFNRNYSQVDRLWSLLPSVYNVHYAVWARANGIPSSKVDMVAFFSLCWSARLTFNYWRRGGYEKGSEDYRWRIVLSKINTPLMFIFNVTFISLFQNVAYLWLICTPTYLILLSSLLTPVPTLGDLLLHRLLLSLILLEWFSDQQQWLYQTAKHTYLRSAKNPSPQKYPTSSLDRGFNTHGLFAYTRHPNFLAEQLIWVTLYIWGVYSTGGEWRNWTIIAPVNYLVLFQLSTNLTEDITSEKYKEYKEYQKRVNRFLPTLSVIMGADPVLGKENERVEGIQREADEVKETTEAAATATPQTRSTRRKAA